MVSYIRFEDLENTSQEFGEISELLHSPDWQAVFQGLDHLRSLAKFRWEEFFAEFPQIIPRVQEVLESPRSNLSKNCLYLISECFVLQRPELEALIEPLLPLILLKCMNEKAFIKAVAREALDNFSQACVTPAGAASLTSFCFNKSGGICDLAFSKLKPMLRQIPPQTALELSLKLLDSKRASILKGTKEILGELKETWEDYESCLTSLDESERNKVEIHLSTPVKKSEGNLREFILNKKKENLQPFNK